MMTRKNYLSLLCAALLLCFLIPAAASADPGAEEAQLIGLCDEVRQAVTTAKSCDTMADSLESLLTEKRDLIRGKIRKGVRQAYPAAVKHCEGLVKQKILVQPLLLCAATTPRISKLIAEAKDVAHDTSSQP